MKSLGSDSQKLTPETLERLFRAFSRSSREMERSHADLQAQVAALREEIAEKDRLLERKKRLEALGLVVAGVAHEFRNPLGSVSLYLDCLQETLKALPAPSAGEASNLAGRIELAVRHLNAVVEDMLVLTRGGTGGADPCDLPRLLEEAILLLRSDLERTGVAFRIAVDPALRAAPGGTVVPGDRDGAVRAFINVLKNAVQAIAGARKPGEGCIDAFLRDVSRPPVPAALPGDPGRRGRRGRRASPAAPRGGDRYLEVTIADNGPGVPPDRLDRLLVPFYTEKQGGVGLGLYIVHTLLERQGGRVEFANREEGGFSVRLLFARSPAQAGRGGREAAGSALRGGTVAPAVLSEVGAAAAPEVGD